MAHEAFGTPLAHLQGGCRPMLKARSAKRKACSAGHPGGWVKAGFDLTTRSASVHRIQADEEMPALTSPAQDEWEGADKHTPTVSR